MAENRADYPQVLLFGDFSLEECQYFQNSSTSSNENFISGTANEDQAEGRERVDYSQNPGGSPFIVDYTQPSAPLNKFDYTLRPADERDSEQNIKHERKEKTAIVSAGVQKKDCVPSSDVRPGELIVCLFNDLNSGNFQGDDKLPICGFNNIGNGCFLNAAVQALFSCRPLQAFLEVLRISDAIMNKNIPALEAFSLLSQEIYYDALRLLPAQTTSINRGEYVQTLPKPVTPHVFQELLRKFRQNTVEESVHKNSSTLTKESQEDVHELLMFLLNKLHEEALQLESDWRENRTGSEQGTFDDDGGEWEEVGSHKQKAVIREVALKDSVISSMFMGKCRATLKVQGSKPSVTVEPFSHLPLGILPIEISHVTDAIRMISKEEHIPGYKKSSDGNELVASKTYTIDQLPNILVLHLLRFTFTNNGSTKIRKPVKFEEWLEFPWEVLSPKHRSSHTSTRYRLLATINHLGQVAVRGHYTASVRRKNTWYFVDDDQVSLADISQVLGPDSQRQAYVLFYERT